MKLPFGVNAVGGLQFRRDVSARNFKALEERVETWRHRPDQLIKGPSFRFGAATISPRQPQLDLLNPVAQFEKKALDISNDDFVIGRNLIHTLPAVGQI